VKAALFCRRNRLLAIGDLVKDERRFLFELVERRQPNAIDFTRALLQHVGDAHVDLVIGARDARVLRLQSSRPAVIRCIVRVDNDQVRAYLVVQRDKRLNDIIEVGQDVRRGVRLAIELADCQGAVV